MKLLLAFIGCLYLIHFVVGAENDPLQDKHEIIERIIAEKELKSTKRFEVRKQRMNEIEQENDITDIEEHNFEDVLQSDEDATRATQQMVDHSQKLCLFANEQIFGGLEEAVFISPQLIHCTDCKRKGISMKQRAQASGTSVLDGNGFDGSAAIIEINLAKDEELKRAINLFVALSKKKPQINQVWLLAQFVRSLFSANDLEEAALKRLSEEEKEIMVDIDDKYHSMKLSILLGDMIGSKHTCAPKAVLFKIISDFVGIPCRLIGSDNHVCNMVLDEDNKWKIVDVAQLNYCGYLLDLSLSAPTFKLPPNDMYKYDEKMKGNAGYSLVTLEEERESVKRTKVRVRLPSEKHEIDFVILAEEFKKFLMCNIDSNLINLLRAFDELMQPTLNKIDANKQILLQKPGEEQERLVQADLWKETSNVCSLMGEFIKAGLKQKRRKVIEWLYTNEKVKEYGKTLPNIDVEIEIERFKRRDEFMFFLCKSVILCLVLLLCWFVK